MIVVYFVEPVLNKPLPEPANIHYRGCEKVGKAALIDGGAAILIDDRWALCPLLKDHHAIIHQIECQPANPIDILLVEDNPGDVRLIQEAFKTTDRETTLHAITDGDDAMEFLTQQTTEDSLPDLVLLDLNLPGKSGCEILRTIRDEPQLQHLPVIMLTSSRANEDVTRCYETGANAYLTKPDDMAAFSSLVETVERFWFERARLPPVPA